MYNVKKVLDLREALTADFARRTMVIDAVYDSFTGAFSSKSVERLKAASPLVLSVAIAIINARDAIKNLAAEGYLFDEAVKILEQEHQYLTMVHEEYVEKIFSKEVTKEWVLKTVDMDRLKSIASGLNSLRIREKALLQQIDAYFLGVAKEKRQVMANFLTGVPVQRGL